ncbi:MAG: MaoC/PaaZ C-terminal domain-containing protein [Dehalococcoidia bacterium]
MPKGKYYEEFNVGDEFVTPARTITESMISTLVTTGGFIAPLFCDAEFARGSVFGTLIAPGKATLLIMDGLEEQHGFMIDTAMAFVGMENVKFKAPLRAGDTIHVHVKVLDRRETSKPDRGLVTHRSTCINQRGETLVETDTTHLIMRKPGSP